MFRVWAARCANDSGGAEAPGEDAAAGRVSIACLVRREHSQHNVFGVQG